MNRKIIIRKMDLERDLDKIMDIWLRSNIDAHDFIDENYWKDNFLAVRSMLPEADIKVACLDKEIVGFMGIKDGYIAGIFVDKEKRGYGLGSKLLEEGKKFYDKLSLDVYKKNKDAYNFYLKKGFLVVDEKYDEENKEIEYTMEYK